ncbi:M15 family metallopeptidase [Nocardioides sp. CN2-186]|uniref:M15 family metallopeptidase n=1 Tax=Nocardioides tweenelious TaxID=3156607 RepID=UPI0032B31B58
MSLGSRLLVVLSSIALLTGLGSPAGAADETTPTTVTITAAPAYADATTTLVVDLVDQSGAPVAGASVLLERSSDGAWTPSGTVTTGADGRATSDVPVGRDPADNAVRATYAGDAVHSPSTAETRLQIQRRSSTLAISGPRSVVDERQVTLTIRWRTGSGQPIAGAVRVYRALGRGDFKPYRTVRTGADGRAELRSTPRSDSRWRARAPQLAWVDAARSSVRRIDNLAPGDRVTLPKGAPSPRIRLPRQPHATGDGAHVVVRRIPDAVWRQMTGVTWHSGCPVGRTQLRLVRVNYWDYSGYRRRGELVANVDAARAMGAALADLYDHELPIRAMYRVDRFGWGSRSRGGDDYASMKAGNTSAFNCRDVTGRPGVRSPHSYGRAIDINTWENPYRSAQGTVPNTWWQPRSHPLVAWRTTSHPVVELMARHGFRWTYGTGDTQHFDYVGSRSRASALPEECERFCD